MSSTAPRTFRRTVCFLSLAPLLLLPPAAQAQQIVSPSAGLPTITAAFNHTSLVTIAGTGIIPTTTYNFNYYDFTITGFHNVGANNPSYDIYSFGNSTLEKQAGVVGVVSAYLPTGWTLDDTHDFDISTTVESVIHADDPQFGLIFIQQLNTAPLNPTGASFKVYNQTGGVDPFVTQNGTPISVLVSAPVVPEASTMASLGLLLLLGLGGLAAAARRKSPPTS